MTTFLILATGLSMIVIGAVTIAGWLLHMPTLAAWAHTSIPMAPLTAVMTAVAGGGLTLCALRDAWHECRRCLAGVAATGVVPATVLILRAFGYYLPIEHLGIGISGSFRGMPLGFMSPLAAACFALSSVALAAQVISGVDRRTRLIAAFTSAIAVAVSGLGSLLTASLGAPEIVGRPFITPALNTSVALLLLGIGLAAMGLQLSDRSSTPSKDRSWRPLALAFALTTALTAVAGYALYRQEETEIHDQLKIDLDRISVVPEADLAAAKARQEAAGFIVQTRVVDSSWALISVTDRRVERAALWERLRWVTAISGLLLISAGAILALVWRNHRVAEYRRRAVLAEAVRLQMLRVSELAARSPAVLFTLLFRDGKFAPIDITSNVDRILGYTVEEALQPAWFETHVVPEDLDRAMSEAKSLASSDELVNEFRFVRKDGTVLWVANHMTVSRRENGVPVEVTGAWHDMTPRKVAELRSERLAGLYEALSECNFAVAHAKSPADLFARVCDAASGIAGVALVWIGMKDDATGRVERVAARGAGAEDTMWSVRADDSELGRGPTGTAIRLGHPCWTDDLAGAPTAGPWRETIARYHWVAGGSFPLRCEGKTIGAVTIYSTSATTFDDESQRLLTEMAASVSSALDYFAGEARRAAADDALRASDAALRATLRDREALLKEVHHRVKNNLQVISSLLRLERDRHDDPGVKSAMSEMQLRILSMALLHETLYKSSDLGHVDLATYLSELANQVFRSSAPSTGRISLALDLHQSLVDIDHAIPCGLLVNEALSNCLKHAFPGDRRGTVTLSLRCEPVESSCTLRISDDGVGLPEDFDRRRSSLGLELIRALAGQLKADLSIQTGAGTAFAITFSTAPRPHKETA